MTFLTGKVAVKSIYIVVYTEFSLYRCSRSHPYPELSSTLLFSGMYAHFGLSQGLSDEFDTGKYLGR